MKRIVGHARQVQLLEDQIHKGRLPSALIFHGASGIGKKTIAKHLLQMMNCTQQPAPCGACSACRRSLEEKNEMVFELHPEEKKSISVDQVREVHRFLSLKTLARARFVIVDPTEALTVQASNSLLKILEEPAEDTYFILITEMLNRILPTIRSRAQTMGFSRLSSDELQQLGVSDDTALHWSGGRVDVANQLQAQTNAQALEESLQLLYAFMYEPPQDWKSRAPWFFSDDPRRLLCLGFWNQLLQKKLHGEASHIRWVPSDYGLIAALFDGIENFKMDVARNVDKQLAAENLFYQFKSLGLPT